MPWPGPPTPCRLAAWRSGTLNRGPQDETRSQPLCSSLPMGGSDEGPQGAALPTSLSPRKRESSRAIGLLLFFLTGTAMAMSLRQLVQAIPSATVEGSVDREVTGIAYDSRRIT